MEVRGRLPRKQGLKHNGKRPEHFCGAVRGRLPRKQGLKHSNLDIIDAAIAKVRGRLPRKQGLKHHFKSPLTIALQDVRGRLPRKQGLKLFVWRLIHGNEHSPRATSTKTRIETWAGIELKRLAVLGSEGDFHENKD